MDEIGQRIKWRWSHQLKALLDFGLGWELSRVVWPGVAVLLGEDHYSLVLSVLFLVPTLWRTRTECIRVFLGRVQSVFDERSNDSEVLLGVLNLYSVQAVHSEGQIVLDLFSDLLRGPLLGGEALLDGPLRISNAVCFVVLNLRCSEGRWLGLHLLVGHRQGLFAWPFCSGFVLIRKHWSELNSARMPFFRWFTAWHRYWIVIASAVTCPYLSLLVSRHGLRRRFVPSIGTYLTYI